MIRTSTAQIRGRIHSPPTSAEVRWTGWCSASSPSPPRHAPMKCIWGSLSSVRISLPHAQVWAEGGRVCASGGRERGVGGEGGDERRKRTKKKEQLQDILITYTIIPTTPTPTLQPRALFYCLVCIFWGQKTDGETRSPSADCVCMVMSCGANTVESDTRKANTPAVRSSEIVAMFVEVRLW